MQSPSVQLVREHRGHTSTTQSDFRLGLEPNAENKSEYLEIRLSTGAEVVGAPQETHMLWIPILQVQISLCI